MARSLTKSWPKALAKIYKASAFSMTFGSYPLQLRIS